MNNMYYRGFVIHEEIRSICYTVFGRRPQRAEMGSRGTALEAMWMVDRHVAVSPAEPVHPQDKGSIDQAARSRQPALL